MSPDPDNVSVTITLRDIWMQMQGMQTTLTELKTEMRPAMEASSDHEARLRLLERFRYTLLGATVMFSGLSGYMGYLIAAATHHGSL